MPSSAQQTSPGLNQNRSDGGIVQLNVGGQIFSTTRDTLNAAGESFFSGLLSGNFGVQHDAKGNLFIDRDPKHFRYVLNYLRSQCTNSGLENETRSKLNTILLEAQFFAVDPLIEEIQARIQEMDRLEELEEKARSRRQWEAAVYNRSVPVVVPATSHVPGPSVVEASTAPQASFHSDEDVSNSTPADAPETECRRGMAEMISHAAMNMDFDF